MSKLQSVMESWHFSSSVPSEYSSCTMWGYFSDDDTANCRSEVVKEAFLNENGAIKNSEEVRNRKSVRIPQAAQCFS